MSNGLLASLIGALISFAATARGAHDIWASTLSYVIVFLLFLLFMWRVQSHPTKNFQIPLMIPLSIFLGTVALSFAFSTNPSDSYLAAADWTAAVLLFLLAANLFQHETAVDVFAACLVPALWIQSAAVVFEVIATRHQAETRAMLQSNSVLGYLFSVPDIFNAEKMGTMVNPNILVGFVTPVLFLLLWRGAADLRAKNIGKSIYWGSGVAASVLCLVFAQSSAGWLCLLTGLLLSLVRFRKATGIQRSKKWIGIALGLMLMGMMVIVVLKFTQKIDHLTDPYRNNSNRFFWWLSAWRMFADHRWFGIGVGGFGNAYLTYKVGGTENTLFAHSFPLGWLAEAGLMGAMGLLILVGAALKKIFSKGLDVISWPPFTALIVASLFYSFNIGLEYLSNLMVYAVMAGLIFSSEKTFFFRPRLSFAIVMTAVFAVVLPYVLGPFIASRHVAAGEIHFQRQQWQEAEKSFKTASELDSQSWEAFAGLARVAVECGDPQTGIGYFKQAIARNRLNAPLKKEMETAQRLLR